MSHHATSWAIRQRGLKPATKLVLWQLCDRYHPDHGCFPSQETLAEDCEMSRASVNRHLDELERRGLIRRIQRSEKRTKRQKSTLYLLGFQSDFKAPGEGGAEAGKAQKPCRKMRHGAVSQKTQKPCLKNGKSRVSNCDTNLVKEPVIEPARDAKLFFTDAERSEARSVVAYLEQGGKVRFEAVPIRVRRCLISEKMLDDEMHKACLATMEKEG
jgi:DNA-binding transcriptional ArsR family regulator